VVRIAGIEDGTIADELQLEIGTRIVRINGERVRDNIDLTFMLADTELELETVSPDGESVIYEVARDPGEPMGIVPAPDTIRECANKCVFCFIDGNPQDVRSSLWLRDDDFRLSFTYGSYVTLTNLGPKGIQRLIDQRISPLFVSVHATEPEVRIRLLKNERSGLILEHLRRFADAGMEVHTQVVLCPEWNDGVRLDRTIADLWEIGPAVRSLSVVPVGLTKYNLNRPVRMLTPEEAGAAIDTVNAARVHALEERGEAWAYVGDEMYLIAGRELPSQAWYDEGALEENGVGAVRRVLTDLDAGIPALPRLEGRRVRIATGASMAPFFAERAPAIADSIGAPVEVVEVVNDFYGSIVTTAGLLAGADVEAALKADLRPEDVLLIPAEALNADELFIDSKPLAEVRAALEPALVVPGHELIDTLHRAAEALEGGAVGAAAGAPVRRPEERSGSVWSVAEG
jgi:putative radical SAM enzyme (TIGR03279 family)